MPQSSRLLSLFLYLTHAKPAAASRSSTAVSPADSLALYVKLPNPLPPSWARPIAPYVPLSDTSAIPCLRELSARGSGAIATAAAAAVASEGCYLEGSSRVVRSPILGTGTVSLFH